MCDPFESAKTVNKMKTNINNVLEGQFKKCYNKSVKYQLQKKNDATNEQYILLSFGTFRSITTTTTYVALKKIELESEEDSST